GRRCHRRPAPAGASRGRPAPNLRWGRALWSWCLLGSGVVPAQPAVPVFAGQALQPLRRTWAAFRASASLRASPALRDGLPPPRGVSLLVPSPRKGRLVFLGRGAAGPPSSGDPEGVLAPVMRLSSASPERTLVTPASMPASAMTRAASRRPPAGTSVTTVPDSPARAVRPARCT